MSGFSLNGYVTVNERLIEAFKVYPNLRVQETFREVVEMPDKSCFIRCVVTVWRDGQDPIPAIASACEVYPGRTSFQKMSENEVGFTSALGRALGYMGFGINKSIASRNEVEAAQGRQPAELAVVVPFPEVEQTFEPSAKQLGMMRALANGQGINQQELKAYCTKVLNREIHTTGDLTKRDVSKIIDALKLGEVKEL